MSRRLATLVLLAVIPLGLGAADGTALAAPAASTHTAVSHVRPVDRHGHLKAGYSVKRILHHGQCSAGSDATNSAYRCFAGNFVVDPCWASVSKRYVYCLLAPWSFKVVEIKVSKGYENAGFSRKQSTLPWGVQLPNGTQCGFIQGASGAVGKRRVNYGCAHASYVLVGNVDKSSPVWTIRKATPAGNHYTLHGRVQLTRAWFGKPTRKA